MKRTKIYIAGKSGDSWYQVPPYVRQTYRAELARLHGSRCCPMPTYTLDAEKKYRKFGCGKYLPLDLLTVDHIIPISKGGPVFDLENMQLLCWNCHQTKTNENDMIEL